MYVLKKDYPYWGVFYSRLNSELIKYGCKGHTLRLTRETLASLKGIDVDGTLAFFRSQGGYCDCAVLHYVFEYEPKPENYFFGKGRKKRRKLSVEEHLERQQWKDRWNAHYGGSKWYS